MREPSEFDKAEVAVLMAAEDLIRDADYPGACGVPSWGATEQLRQALTRYKAARDAIFRPAAENLASTGPVDGSGPESTCRGCGLECHPNDEGLCGFCRVPLSHPQAQGGTEE